MKITTPYINLKGNIDNDTYKLICIPCAGYGASFYNDWQEMIGSEITILPIQLPGHENRICEPLMHDCCKLASLIADEISKYVYKGKFAVLGHSMGGILSYEVSKRLTDIGYSPNICFISSTSIEDWTGVIPSMKLNDNDFFDRVAKFGGIDKDSEILKYPEFKSIFMKILRADFDIIESYIYDGNKLSCPTVCMCGDNDPMENLENMKSWENYIVAEKIKYIEYSGDHFYFNKQLEKVCNDIKEIISKNMS